MVERVSDLFVEVCREDGDGLVVAQADGGESGEIDCRGHDETVCIIGMLADYVDAARCGERDGLQPKPLQVKGPVSAYIEHGSLTNGNRCRCQQNLRYNRGNNSHPPEVALTGSQDSCLLGLRGCGQRIDWTVAGLKRDAILFADTLIWPPSIAEP